MRVLISHQTPHTAARESSTRIIAVHGDATRRFTRKTASVLAARISRVRHISTVQVVVIIPAATATRARHVRPTVVRASTVSVVARALARVRPVQRSRPTLPTPVRAQSIRTTARGRATQDTITTTANATPAPTILALAQGTCSIAWARAATALATASNACHVP